ncbi:MAG: protein-disulfide reductase DsbD domain-containing protein, partial [Verrucomicrobiota bacterium]
MSTTWAQNEDLFEQFGVKPPAKPGSVTFRTSHSQVKPGQTFHIAMDIAMQPKWHTYWSNPGDSGEATSLSITLPDGFKAGPLQFPTPKRFVTDYGDNFLLGGYGYENRVIHVMAVTVPEAANAGSTFQITGEGKWFICKDDECITDGAPILIEVTVGENSTESADAKLIADTLADQPKAADWAFTAKEEGETLKLDFVLTEGETIPEGKPEFYEDGSNEMVSLIKEQKASIEGNTLTLTTSKNDNFDGVPANLSGLVKFKTDTGYQAYRVFADTEERAAALAGEARPPASDEGSKASAPRKAAPLGKILKILGLAFLGGMVLN